ncbi:MAG: prepilin-type N-terminal cleavage/methylation domain-containing protein, partial [Deltaproteobacteria bacterium]|nr:prepilin-type N-terminal cleavage/methylation domain-containing protein [Deltaproteobacteria bacterium]
MRRSELSEGFTLLEVLIALIIFVTVMGGLIK